MSENEISEISGTDFEDSGSEYTPSDKENQRNRHRSRKKLVIPESSDESSVEEANDGISSKEVAEDDSVCKSRKRKRNVWNWKKEKAKRARAFGQAYLNVKGSSVPAKIFNSEDCKRTRFSSSLTDINLDVLYPNGRPIEKKKYEDLLQLLPYVLPIRHDFYRNLKTNNSAQDTEADFYDDDLTQD
ncbi:unnamed protein product, partial [Brenthis ino]